MDQGQAAQQSSQLQRLGQEASRGVSSRVAFQLERFCLR